MDSLPTWMPLFLGLMGRFISSKYRYVASALLKHHYLYFVYREPITGDGKTMPLTLAIPNRFAKGLPEYPIISMQHSCGAEMIKHTSLKVV